MMVSEERYPEKWKMKDGNSISIEDMETSHIKNTVSMLQGKGFIPHSELVTFMSCNPPNGDMAMLAWEQGLEEVLERPTTNYLDYFKSELEDRKERP